MKTRHIKNVATLQQSNLPTKPGVYWYHMHGGYIWHHQEVFRYSGYNLHIKGLLCVNNGEGPVPIQRMHRHWREGSLRPKPLI